MELLVNVDKYSLTFPTTLPVTPIPFSSVTWRRSGMGGEEEGKGEERREVRKEGKEGEDRGKVREGGGGKEGRKERMNEGRKGGGGGKGGRKERKKNREREH
jgi:hypothetical protein